MEQKTINNAFYEELNDGWYTALNHPVALLRAENRLRTPWILEHLAKHFKKPIRILDIGCGAGLLTNALALKDHETYGIDLSRSSLEAASRFDQTKKVNYQEANAYDLPFEDQSFDAVCALDVLEHVERPKRLIEEASRVLKPNGLFFFHTFNRNFLSYLLIIKGVEWFVKNTPKNMHVYPLFIRPEELRSYCQMYNLHCQTFVGMRPDFLSAPFWKMLFTRNVPADFSFTFSKSLQTGYCGIATKG